MVRPKKDSGTTTCVTISQELRTLCVEHNISFSEALRVGISFLLAEKGVMEYDNSLNLFRKLNVMREELERVSAKYHDLKSKHEA